MTEISVSKLKSIRENIKPYRDLIRLLLICCCMIGVFVEVTSIRNNLQYEDGYTVQELKNTVFIPSNDANNFVSDYDSNTGFQVYKPKDEKLDLTGNSKVIWSLVNLQFYLFVTSLLWPKN